MNYLSLILFCVAVATVNAADTNRLQVLTTNIVYSVPWFRDVNGRLYNTQRSTNFIQIKGSVSEVFSNSVLVFWQRQYWTVTGYPADSEQKDVIVINYSPPDIAVGQLIYLQAMRIGTTNFDGQRIELYDYGTPHKVEIVTTNFVQKPN
jgi:hypothetical protein